MKRLTSSRKAARIHRRFNHQLLRVMQLTAIILLSACMAVSAHTVSQTVSLEAKNVSLEKVFKEVRKQTGYFVFYNRQVIRTADLISVSAKNMPLNDFLTTILHGQPLEFAIEAETVIIKEKKDATAPSAPFPGEMPPITVTGRIVNESGDPVIASIIIKGTKRGVTSNADGSFEITNVDDDAVLVISGTTIDTKEVSINGKSTLVISTVTKVSQLDETVVIAYGKTSQRYATGNVAMVTSKDIQKAPVTNPIMAIQGRVPGLLITQQSGYTGAAVNVQIQGKNSIGKGNDPFYVIDGVPFTSQLLDNYGTVLGTSGDNLANSGSPLNYLNPMDIESISVLKDADATAIYGSRAANGAIIITTKKGSYGALKVNLWVDNGWSKVTRKVDLLNTQQYLEMRHEAKNNDGIPVSPTDYDINGFWDTTRNTDWQDELLGKTAKYSNINVNLTGGTQQVQYLVGGTLHRETSIFPTDASNKRAGFISNLTLTSLNKRFKANFGANILLDDNRIPNGDPTSAALNLPPDAPALYNPDGTLNWKLTPTGSNTFSNPMAQYESKYSVKGTNLIANGGLEYEIIDHLKILTTLGYNKLTTDELVQNPLSMWSPSQKPFRQRNGYYGNYNISSWIIEPQLTYSLNANRHNFNALLGTTIQENNADGVRQNGVGYLSDDMIADIKSAANVTVVGTEMYKYRYNALFGRINYIYNQKYILNINARRDGSSRFGAENRFHNFGSIAGAWIFSEEGFLRNAVPFISFGKLSLSYGSTGSDQIGNYEYLSLYNTVSNNLAYRNYVSLTPNGISNPYLQWEETKKFNSHLDIGVLKDRILLGVTYFKNRSSNQLRPRTLPQTAGVSSVTLNYPATVENSGFEFTAHSRNIETKSFSWETSINLTIPKNKLVAYPDLETSFDANILTVGQPITFVRLYHYMGVNKETGLYDFADAEGKPVTYPEKPTVILNTSPKFYGGITNTVTFKSVTLDFLLQFVNSVKENFRAGLNMPGLYRINQPVSVLNRWQKPGDEKPVQRFNTDFSAYDSYGFLTTSDYVWSNAAYVRLKNISLSWQIPSGWINKAKMKSCRVFAQGQNLLTFTNYEGLDPETGARVLPPLRTLVLGAQLSF